MMHNVNTSMVSANTMYIARDRAVTSPAIMQNGLLPQRSDIFDTGIPVTAVISAGMKSRAPVSMGVRPMQISM